MYKAHRELDGYIIMHNECPKLVFTREEADAIVNALNRNTHDNTTRTRRFTLRKRAAFMNVPKKER